MYSYNASNTIPDGSRRNRSRGKRKYTVSDSCVVGTDESHLLMHFGGFLFQGSVLAKGSYRRLRASGFDFEKLLGFAEETATASDRKNERNDTDTNPNGSSPVLSVRRLGSDDSVASFDRDKRNLDGAHGRQYAEIRSSGRVASNVYSSYITAGGSAWKIGLVVFLYVFCQILTTGGDYWISYW